MKGSNTILSQLKNFELTPPQHITDSILNGIKKVITESQSLESSSASVISIQALKNYSINPPVNAFQKIWEAITAEILSKKNRYIPVIQIKRLAAAAAFVGLMFFAWSIFKNYSTQTENNEFAKLPSTSKKLPPPITDSVVKTTIAVKQPSYKKSKTIKRRKLVANTGEEEFNSTPVDEIAEYSIGDYNLTVYNSEYLATFINFNESSLPPFFKDNYKGGEIRIRIDKSNSINVSENMIEIIKKMYKTRKSGKPTNRARRMKRKLESWKRTDSSYFDVNINKSPLDPVDLGNLIF